MKTSSKNILVINSGSSSLKFELFGKLKIKGHIDGIGLKTCKIQINTIKLHQEVKNHHEAIDLMFHYVDPEIVDAIGHRVVHGGEYYKEAVRINQNVILRIKELCDLAPLHNPHNLDGIIICKKLLPKIPQVAVFDTAFHQTIPKKAFLYGIPYLYYLNYKIRKYGFHGTSHKYVMGEALKLLKKKKVNIITCHLGNGSSITAIKNNISVDTSMGFTPLQGLIMGTRSGDIDPEIIEFLEKKEKKKTHEILEILNKKSGLFGIDGYSDVRTIHDKALKGNKMCQLALDMLAYDIVNYIGSYTAVLGKVDAIIFTGGIGQGAWYLREKIANDLNIKINSKKNKNHETIFSLRSKTKLMIIPTNEEFMIAKETNNLIFK